jgi:hypothetical protein
LIQVSQDSLARRIGTVEWDSCKPLGANRLAFKCPKCPNCCNKGGYPMGRASRRKRERREAESPESREFREHMRGEELDEMLAAAGIDPATLDWDALVAVSHLVGVLPIDGENLLVIRPKRSHAEHEDFDRVICRAGLKRFVRRPMDSDRPGHGTPIDPAMPVPDVDFGDYVVVEEVTRGVRLRLGIFTRQGAAS